MSKKPGYQPKGGGKPKAPTTGSGVQKPRPPVDLPFAAPSTVKDLLQRVSVAKITPHPENPRIHPKAQIDSLQAAYEEFGMLQPPVLDENLRLMVGEGRWLAARAKGMEEVDAVVVTGWSESKKRRFMVADNRIAQLGGYDDDAYRAVLSIIRDEGLPIDALGFTDDTLEAALDEITEQERGKLLERVDVTIKDPKHEVSRGDHFILTDKEAPHSHHLLCESVISGWPKWGPLLKDAVMFCPYPGVFVPFSVRAKTHSLVMVQGDPYIAGHILDRWVEIHGKKAVKKVDA